VAQLAESQPTPPQKSTLTENRGDIQNRGDIAKNSWKPRADKRLLSFGESFDAIGSN
jgi:hypothetical protein